ncbi:DUF1449 domain-containing protein [Streptomyces sp. AJS327]|uniref:OB-fold-containig protein n=1 Tax=Streptomyces sp. AJS327 TaxID=2545265 RepID=UPI0015DD98D4|nr:OB-fold-containig protein [Streptomyces sp. AJS327]MBA0049720.1 DUF1449 domain-containing protein [Streptomyces sp. AJS327]
MHDFLDVALSFPAALFTFALAVVVVYWLLTLVGGLGVDAFDGGEGIGPTSGGAAPTGFAGVLSALGLGGVPVTVVLSLVTAIAWFVSLAAAALTGSVPLRAAALPVALLLAYGVTRLFALSLRRFAPREKGIELAEFVGRVCVLRTGRVSPDFGQAEVVAEDGSTALIQVRVAPEPPLAPAESAAQSALTAGDSALIYAYEAEGSFFWIAPYDAALDPNQPPS